VLPAPRISAAIPEWLMIDHVGLGVRDLERSKAFYQQALHPLGYTLLLERNGSAGLGMNGKPDC
jgi:catechol 2,3-dioxygenase-like lactoylglutathione lyase family enzyme